MALLAKVTIPIVVLIGLITGGWYLKHEGAAPKQQTVTQEKNGTQKGENVKADVAASISSRDSSNDSLEKDSAAIDTQMKMMDSSNSEVDAKDQPVSQDSL